MSWGIAAAFIAVKLASYVFGFWCGVKYSARALALQMKEDPRWHVQALIRTVGKERIKRLVKIEVPLS